MTEPPAEALARARRAAAMVYAVHSALHHARAVAGGGITASASFHAASGKPVNDLMALGRDLERGASADDLGARLRQVFAAFGGAFADEIERVLGVRGPAA